MQSDVAMRPITVDEARTVRDLVLRPGMPPGGSVYPGDHAEDTGHFGAFVQDRLIAVASVCRQAPRTRVGSGAAETWRLRGMATVEDWRGRGIGERLALWCVSHARRHAARLVWCSARERAVAFYARLGFRAVGEPYELPQYSDERYVELHLRL